MRPLSLVRFNALAAYARAPMATALSEEMAWFEHDSERVLGAVARDVIDDDFAGVVFARDRRGRFRAVWVTGFEPTRRRAQALLRREMERLALAPDEEYYQGDEKADALDFFTPRTDRTRLHRHFLALTEAEYFSAARGIIEPMMHWYEDPDGNFIEQFQTTGFDARLWELYLFAVFAEMSYRIERVHAVPDFVCAGLLGTFAVEAMTVNPTQDAAGGPVPPPPRRTPEELAAFVSQYMPIKFGSTLTSKLAKKYWERLSARGKPLLFAIQDFSGPGSMVYTHSALAPYLYGYNWESHYDGDGRLVVTPKKIATHRWGAKEIPSGFFDLPGAENVSAVLFSNSGTISKFNRMGVLAGFGSKRLVLTRKGTAYNHDRDSVEPTSFEHVVGGPGYRETWGEGLNVFHNPKAVHPLDPEMLPDAAHLRLRGDGLMASVTPEWHPFGSITRVFVADTEEEARRLVQAGS
ncbi:MAG: hypothetical protein HY615_01785 [Candidatus Rokubacteria bacterium]|nr:hypothetical protein [Candidatus Rokubacteria bacterium]